MDVDVEVPGVVLVLEELNVVIGVLVDTDNAVMSWVM